MFGTQHLLKTNRNNSYSIVIHTAAVEMLSGVDAAKSFSRKPDIVADAVYAIITKSADQYTGQFFIDDEVLLHEGIADFDQYLSDPSKQFVFCYFNNIY